MLQGGQSERINTEFCPHKARHLKPHNSDIITIQDSTEIQLAICFRDLSDISQPLLIGGSSDEILLNQVFTGLCSGIRLGDSLRMVFLLQHELTRNTKHISFTLCLVCSFSLWAQLKRNHSRAATSFGSLRKKRGTFSRYHRRNLVP